MVEYIFPQDSGTGAYSANAGDPNDAANFGALVGAAQPTAALINGCGLTNVDFTNLTFDVNAGKVYLVGDNITAATSGESRDTVGFVTSLDAVTGQTLVDSATNHVFVAFDPSVNDDPYITVNTDNTAPSDPSLKIGEIDTSNDTMSEQWHRIEDDGTLSFPDTDSATNSLSSLPDGVTIINRINGVRMSIGTASVPTVETNLREVQMMTRRNN